MGIVPQGPATKRSTPEPCPFPHLARIGSYSRYRPNLCTSKHILHLLELSFPLPPVFHGPVILWSAMNSASQTFRNPLKGCERHRQLFDMCALALRRGRLAYAIYLRSLVRSAHTSSASFPTFPRTVTWNSRMHLGARWALLLLTFNDSYFLHPLPTIPLYRPMMLSIPPTASEKSICYAHNLPSCKMLCHRIQ
jgi:hypothetical protein